MPVPQFELGYANPLPDGGITVLIRENSGILLMEA